jgi:hypothetical protein
VGVWNPPKVGVWNPQVDESEGGCLESLGCQTPSVQKRWPRALRVFEMTGAPGSARNERATEDGSEGGCLESRRWVSGIPWNPQVDESEGGCLESWNPRRWVSGIPHSSPGVMSLGAIQHRMRWRSSTAQAASAQVLSFDE